MKLSKKICEKFKWFLLLLLITFSFFNSCEYDTDSLYNRKINQNPISPEIELKDSSFFDDTLYQYGRYNVYNFTFQSSNHEIFGAAYLIDGTDSVFVKPVNGTFSIIVDLPEGIHTLTVEIITHTGSSSIADILEMEGLIFTRSWIIIIDTTPMDYFRKEVVNGYLKLSLRKYRNPDLKDYEISKFNGSTYIMIGRSKTPDFIDSTYIGEKSKYRVIVNKINGQSLIWNEFSLNSEIPQSYLSNNSGKYYAWWNKVKYVNAVDKYLIEYVVGMSYYLSDVKSFYNSPNDTT